MSHRSKIDFFARAREAGYRIYLYFVATERPDPNVQRVTNRAALGGHGVPENKIRERYERCLQLLGDALTHAVRAFLFDNSGTEPVCLALLTPSGEFRIEVPTNALPNWFRTWVGPRYRV
jgi:predicted ABC-type ATPase